MIFIIVFIFIYFGCGFFGLPKIIVFSCYLGLIVFIKYLIWRFPKKIFLEKLYKYFNYLSFGLAIYGGYVVWAGLYYCQSKHSLCMMQLLF